MRLLYVCLPFIILIILFFWGPYLWSFLKGLFHLFGGAVDELADGISSESGKQNNKNNSSNGTVGSRIIAALILFGVIIVLFYYFAPDTFMAFVNSISKLISGE